MSGGMINPQSNTCFAATCWMDLDENTRTFILINFAAGSLTNVILDQRICSVRNLAVSSAVVNPVFSSMSKCAGEAFVASAERETKASYCAAHD